MIGIVDYNMGNLQSVINAYDSLGVKAKLESDPEKLKNYDKLLLPGVGAFGDAMRFLRKNGMDEAVKEYVKSGRYLIGICLGMQVLFEKGYEFGEHEGLGLIKGSVSKFEKEKFDEDLKIPHMGWNSMKINNQLPIFNTLSEDVYLYFVHSFHANCDEKYTIGTTKYGYTFVSAVQNENIIGIQPHPEKSHKDGLKILENFAKI